MARSHISDDQLIRLWDSGLTMTEIGQRVALSRERVRQRLKLHGRIGSNPNAVPEPEAILAAFRQEALPIHAAHTLNVSIERLWRGIERAGIEDQIEALILARRVAGREHNLERKRSKLIDRTRSLAQRVGHTPTQCELMNEGIYHAELARYFGSASSAMIAAGLEPNVRGAPPRPLPR